MLDVEESMLDSASRDRASLRNDVHRPAAGSVTCARTWLPIPPSKRSRSPSAHGCVEEGTQVGGAAAVPGLRQRRPAATPHRCSTPPPTSATRRHPVMQSAEPGRGLALVLRPPPDGVGLRRLPPGPRDRRRTSTTSRRTARSRRIRRWPSPSVVTSRASGRASTSRSASAYGVCRSPGRGRPASAPARRARPGPARRTRRREGRRTRPAVPVEGPPGAGAEAEGGLELVEQVLGLHHRRDQHQALGPEPAEAQRQVRRDRTQRVRDDGLRGAEPAKTASSALPNSTP